jgi:hypothetical protein
LVLAGLLATTASAAPVFFDNFDAENGGVGTLNYTGFAQWDVTAGSVDLIGNGFYDFFPGNGLYLDMDGSTGAAGTIVTQDGITLQPGAYELSFALAGNQRGYGDDQVTAQVSLGAIYSESFILSSGVPFTTYTRQFSIASPTVVSLSFAAAGNDNVGMLLDNVTLATVIPLPAAAWPGLALLATLAAAKTLRRRLA